ncbi:MAG: hypothetical protein AB3X44_06180 [Leptothrix sp. (in: b-proteobacteria)]
MRTLRLWFFALFSMGWLVPFVMAWNSVLSYLNDDLARLHLSSQQPTPSAVLVINEALNITDAREMLYASAGWLALVILGWCLYALRRPTQVAAAAQVVAAPQAESYKESRSEADTQLSGLEELVAQRMLQLDERLERMTSLLKASGQTLDSQLGDLRDQLQRTQSVNSSTFSDLTAQSTAANDTKRLQQVVLNLSDLQADLRMMRRQQRSTG